MKISIVYFSQTGNTEERAKIIAEGATSVPGIEVKCMNIAEEANVDAEFVNESKAVIFGTPTYMGNMCWQLKKWFDTDKTCKLAGKMGSVFATENSPHGGGAELAIMTTVNHMLVKGMLVYSSGVGCGQPFIHIGPTSVTTQENKYDDTFKLFGKRVAEKAKEIFS